MGLRKKMFSAIADGFNRLDELGGDARDAVIEWLDRSPTAARLKELARRRSEARDAAVAEAVAAEAAERAAEAPPAPARKPEPPLGDPSIPVQVYGGRSCPWSGRAVRLLEDRGIEHQFVDLDDSENEILGNRLVTETRQNTVPYIFVRGEFIGGYNALSERDRLGQLGPDHGGEGRVKIEVAERPNTDEVAPAQK